MECNTESFSSFYRNLNQNYFEVIGDLLKAHSFTGNILIDMKNDSTAMFVIVLGHGLHPWILKC